MKTCVLPFSRRNGFEWTMRSRSRWNSRTHAALLLGQLAPARLERANGERRQRRLERAYPLVERAGVGSDDVHTVRVEA